MNYRTRLLPHLSVSLEKLKLNPISAKVPIVAIQASECLYLADWQKLQDLLPDRTVVLSLKKLGGQTVL